MRAKLSVESKFYSRNDPLDFFLEALDEILSWSIGWITLYGIRSLLNKEKIPAE